MAITTRRMSSPARFAARRGCNSTRWYIRRCVAGWATSCMRSPCRPAHPRTESDPPQRQLSGIEDQEDGRYGSTAHPPEYFRHPRRAVHEGVAGVSAMRLLGRRGADPEPSRGQVQRRRRAVRPGDPPRDQGILELADDPAALRQGGVRRRLRHHSRNVRNRRIAAALRTERRAHPRLGPRHSRLTRGDMAAKAQRIIDVVHRLQAAARAANANGPITENAAENRLVDVDALYLASVHLERMTGDQTGFIDDTLISHRQLGCHAPNERAKKR